VSKGYGNGGYEAEIFYHAADDNSASNGAPVALNFPPPEYKIDLPKDFGVKDSDCPFAITQVSI
jgi:hypothetical protein